MRACASVFIVLGALWNSVSPHWSFTPSTFAPWPRSCELILTKTSVFIDEKPISFAYNSSFDAQNQYFTEF